MNVKKASVIQNIGSEIITFLAQLEDFQKALYLKKKICNRNKLLHNIR